MSARLRTVLGTSLSFGSRCKNEVRGEHWTQSDRIDKEFLSGEGQVPKPLRESRSLSGPLGPFPVVWFGVFSARTLH